MLSLASCAATISAPVHAEADAEAFIKKIDAGWLSMPLLDGAELRYLPPVVTHKDYPASARRNDVEGTSVLRLQVDPSGHIMGCTTVRSSGSPELDERACQIYRERGRFELRGRAQPVTILAPVEWRLMSEHPSAAKGYGGI